MENLWQKFQANVPLRRIVVLLVLIMFLYEVRAMMDTILLTFIFTFLIVHLVRMVQRHLPRMSTNLIVVITYLIILGLLYFAVTIYMPMIVHQLSSMFRSLLHFYENNGGVIGSYLERYVSRAELINQAKNGMNVLIHTLTSVGSLTFATFMSLILSFFYTIELKRMREFSLSFIKSGFLKWFFQDIYYFGKKFTNTFGLVLEAQFLIALCNTALTLICLAIMGMPQIVALGLMVFVLSLIPVAGVIISFVPLSLVAYSVGGLRYVIYILIMIIVIHIIEAYVLNPKLMSSKTELPIFYTFLILLVAEHFWGGWGLIVGVPVFTFLLDVLGIRSVKNKDRFAAARFKARKQGEKKK